MHCITMTYSTSYCHLTCGSMECNKDVHMYSHFISSITCCVSTIYDRKLKSTEVEQSLVAWSSYWVSRQMVNESQWVSQSLVTAACDYVNINVCNRIRGWMDTCRLLTVADICSFGAQK
jgi:hypothetical protein